MADTGARNDYNAELAKVQANPGAYNPNERASFFGHTFGAHISPQEYLGALQNIYGPGSGWGGGGSSGGGGGGGGSVAAAPAFDQVGANQINAALGNLGVNQNAGYSNIDNNYNSALQQLLRDQQQAKATNDKNVQQNTTSYVGAKNTIGANAGSTLNGLLRLLGSHGAGGSSAALYSAPDAVGRQATQQRTGAGDTYAQNQQGLAQNWGTYMQGYNDNVANEGVQRQNDRSNLENSIAGQRGTLLNQLAGLQGQSAGARNNYLAQANALAAHIAGYVPAPVHITTNAYQAPSLASYVTAPGATPTVQGQQPTNDYTSPYLAALTGKKQPSAAASLGVAAAPVPTTAAG